MGKRRAARPEGIGVGAAPHGAVMRGVTHHGGFVPGRAMLGCPQSLGRCGARKADGGHPRALGGCGELLAAGSRPGCSSRERRV